MDHLLHDSSPITRKRKLAPDSIPDVDDHVLSSSSSPPSSSSPSSSSSPPSSHSRSTPRPHPYMNLKPDPTTVAPDASQDTAVATDVASRHPAAASAASANAAAWTAISAAEWSQSSPTTEPTMSWAPQSAAQPPSPSSPKRPRTESIPPPPQPVASTPRRGKAPPPVSTPRRRRRPTSTRENGQAEAEPSSKGSFPFEPNTAYLPSVRPPVTRETLKELDLDSILRNPQLRHDLLFDSGLQFRPTASRRKRDVVEGYWAAIQRELENGCTCASFDSDNQPCALMCACEQPPVAPTSPQIAYFHRERVMTVRMPSRVPPLLAELLAILLSVIQPLPSATPGVYMQKPTGSPQGQRLQQDHHASQASRLHEVLDPAFIKQEVDHRLFDPRGMFRVIGETLKCHCAPMRDGAVEAMVAVGQTCAPGAGGTYESAVKAMRMCFEVLEFMKLDIANHQLQTLRPYLVQTSPDFERKTFRERYPESSSCDVTREWLNAAYDALRKAPSSAPLPSSFSSIPRKLQIKYATLKASTDIVFEPPVPQGAAGSSKPTTLSAYPETLHLDQTRLHTLSVTAADLTALYMYTMLFRQLVHSGAPATVPECSTQACVARRKRKVVPRIEDEDLARMKREIWEVGPSKLGLCFWRPEPPAGSAASTDSPSKEERDWARWRRKTRDVALQLAVRATAVQRRAMCSCSAEEGREIAPPCSPSAEMVALAERWVESNLRKGSPLSVLFRDRLRAAVFAEVVANVKTGVAPSGSSATTTSATAKTAAATPTSSPASAGLEPLMREIRHLADKVDRIATAHFNVYSPIYEESGFLAA